MEETVFGGLAAEVVGSVVCLVGVIQHQTVFEPWVMAVTELQVVVAIVCEVWTVTLFGP